MELGDIRTLIVAEKKPWMVVQVRKVTTGDEFRMKQRTYIEKNWTPDDDISNESDEVKSLCNSTWTDEVKKLFEDNKKGEPSNEQG